jgi:resuscitation-promoting factor RpfB
MNKKVRRGLTLAVILSPLLVFVSTQQKEEVPLPPKEVVIEARTKATKEEKRENKALVISYAKALGYTKQEVKCLVALWTRESRLDHLADNPRSTAAGIAQLLRERSREPELQILHGLRYLEHRYGKSACRALRHSDRRGWY